jgi:hypothetical protein
MPEVYIRGNTIKYVRVPDEVVDKVKEEQLNRKGVWGGEVGGLRGEAPLHATCMYSSRVALCWHAHQLRTATVELILLL